MKQDEIDRCLVLVYQSRNNAMHVNYNVLCERVDRLCLIPKAKNELVRTLSKLADDMQRKYPSRNMLIRELAVIKGRGIDLETANSMDDDGKDALDTGVAEWIEKVTDKAGSHNADWLVLEAAGELLNDLHIRLCHARMLLLTCKCPSIRGSNEYDSYGIFSCD